MSTAHSHDNTVPRPALVMAGALVAFTLVMTASVSLGLVEREAVPTVERAKSGIASVDTRELRFSDREDGSVLVQDAGNDREIAVVGSESEGSGFIRGVLRGLARERRMHGIGSEPPFELTLWQNGALSLTDTATGRIIELGSFGPDNRATFLALLRGESRS